MVCLGVGAEGLALKVQCGSRRLVPRRVWIDYQKQSA